MRQRFSRTRLLGVIGAAALLTIGYAMGRAHATGIPPTHALSYTGMLLNNGVPDTRPHAVTVELWAAGASSAACSTTWNGTPDGGRFTVALDDTCVAAIHANPALEVKVLVDGSSLGQTAVTAVPYSVETQLTDGSIGASKLADGSIGASKLAPGSIGPAQIDRSSGVLADNSQVEIVSSNQTFLNENTQGGIGVDCRGTNDIPLGGGCESGGESLVLVTSRPTARGWSCWGRNYAGEGSRFIQAHVRCLKHP